VLRFETTLEAVGGVINVHAEAVYGKYQLLEVPNRKPVGPFNPTLDLGVGEFGDCFFEISASDLDRRGRRAGPPALLPKLLFSSMTIMGSQETG
jgi:hypothetical protein